MKFPLSKPIKAHGQELTELEWIEPSGKDVRELGYPFSAVPSPSGEPDLKLFPDIGARYISRLAKIPLSSVDQMAPGDLLLLHTEICGFFGEGQAATSSNGSST